MKKICHCAKCDCENFCAACNWSLANENDPCCPNMKAYRKQLKQEYEQWLIDQKLGF